MPAAFVLRSCVRRPRVSQGSCIASTTTTMTVSSAPQLDYGLAPPRRRKRVMRLIILGIALLVGAAAWQWGEAVWNQLPMLFWQRQCMRYTASPNDVVYEEDPAE